MQAVGERAADLRTWISDTRFAGDADRLAVRLTHEFIFVLDGPHPGVMSQLDELSSAGNSNIIIVSLSRPFGESTALMAGLERASGDVLMTLPAYPQIDGRDEAVARLRIKGCEKSFCSAEDRHGQL